MNTVLTMQEKLKDLRTEKGLTLEQLEKHTGISKSALGSYEIDDCKDISHTSIVTLAKFYGVSTDYLLGLAQTKNHPNADVASLHLDDVTIKLLKSGKINTRLLCEMAAHKDFVKLLADIEIYVDGIADMQIQSLNVLIDMAKSEIIKQYQSGEDDPHLRILEAAHIKDDDYFCHRVHGDIDRIIMDIRKAHKKDSTSAPVTTVAEKIQQALQEAADFTGSMQEKRVIVMCRQLGIDYTKLRKEEFMTMIEVLKKSEHLRGHGKKNGRKHRF